MKFFTCCSTKMENQTVEPQILSEQTECPSQSLTVGVSFFGIRNSKILTVYKYLILEN